MDEGSTLLGAARVRELLALKDVRPRKALGQNFVIDPNTIRKVIAVAKVQPGDRVLEIGPGVGSLTNGLLDAGASVTAIEVDERLASILSEQIEGRDAQVVVGDALNLDLETFGAPSLIANLPYNAAATIVLKVLESFRSIASIVVMTQREVGERFVAEPGSKVYGATSVLAAFYARAELAARISRNAFYPVPNVDSVLVRLERSTQRHDVDEATFRSVVKAAFGQRRKTMRNSIAKLVGPASSANDALTSAGIAPDARPESLAVDRFVSLARVLDDLERGRA